MRRVLFLDFDGVCNSNESLREHRLAGCPLGLDPYHVAKLKRIVDATDCDVVISSTWRLFHDRTALEVFLAEAGLEVSIAGRTPDLSQRLSERALYRSVERCEEISAWLVDHPEVTTFAIVDDDTDAGLLHPERYVRTTFDTGLQDEHVELAVAILMTEAPAASSQGDQS